MSCRPSSLVRNVPSLFAKARRSLVTDLECDAVVPLRFFCSIPGHTPELVTFDHTGAEMFRENVEGKSVDEIRNMLIGYGFSEEDYTMKQPEL